MHRNVLFTKKLAYYSSGRAYNLCFSSMNKFSPLYHSATGQRRKPKFAVRFRYTYSATFAQSWRSYWQMAATRQYVVIFERLKRDQKCELSPLEHTQARRRRLKRIYFRETTTTTTRRCSCCCRFGRAAGLFVLGCERKRFLDGARG